jgi:cytochrome c
MRKHWGVVTVFLVLVSAASARDWPLIFPDGRGLPPGQGHAREGELLYKKVCSRCHGADALGGTAPELVGGEGPLTRPDADKTIKTYWPYATTLFDTVRRGMPPENPDLLSDEEVYALTAFILSKNGLWPVDQALNAERLPTIQMPNRRGFKRLVP